MAELNDRLSFKSSSISEFRTECMGIAALWVLAVHALDFGIHLPAQLAIVEKIMGYGQVGVNMFFFLSGIGIYYALSRECGIKEFYCNRAKRVLVPYLVISIPCLLILQIANGFEPVWFILDLTTLSYWIAQRGAWYVAVILLFYVLIPFYYKVYKVVAYKMLFMLGTVVICAIFSVLLNPLPITFLRCLGGAIARFPVFLAGFWLAEHIKKERKVSFWWIVLMVISVPIRSLFHLEKEHIAVMLTLELWGIAVCFIVSKVLEMKWAYKVFHKVLYMLGSSSLEVYLLNIYLSTIFDKIMEQFHMQNRILVYSCNVVLSISIGYFIRHKLLIALQNSHRTQT